jgi:hypothetical protein
MFVSPKTTDKHLRVPMSASAMEAVERAAKERGYKSVAAFVRGLLAEAIPELQDDFRGVGWGGDRRAEKSS